MGKVNKAVLFSILALAGAAFYFSGIGFEFSVFEQFLAALAVFAFFFAAAKRGLHQFFLVALAAFGTALSLGCAFGRGGIGTGPLAVDLFLPGWAIVALTALVAGVAWLSYERWRSQNRFAVILLTLFVLNWIILAFNVKYYDDWKLENYLTVPFVVLLYLIHRWFRFSNVSYGLLFLYMMLHIYGSHYTYAEVPFGFWLQDFLDMARNHYDRIVHFGFGFLLAYPLREVVLRVSSAKGFWGLYIPIEFTLAFSAIYEIIEWIIAIVYGGDLGIAYLGTQGDVWDAQKDMALAGGGALLAMGIVALILFYYRGRDFWEEFKISLRVKQKEALGEEALRAIKGE